MSELLAITYQIRVLNFEEGLNWYETLLNRKPSYEPHENFAEWELVPNAWLQVAKGEPALGSGPLRLGVNDVESERQRLIKELNIYIEEVQRRAGVPAAWCTFEDPDGNRIGLFQDLSSE